MIDIRQLDGKNYLVSSETDGDALVKTLLRHAVFVTDERELFWLPDGPQGDPGIPENTVLVEEERSQE